MLVAFLPLCMPFHAASACFSLADQESTITSWFQWQTCVHQYILTPIVTWSPREGCASLYSRVDAASTCMWSTLLELCIRGVGYCPSDLHTLQRTPCTSLCNPWQGDVIATALTKSISGVQCQSSKLWLVTNPLMLSYCHCPFHFYLHL